jgi:hypothetical protein
LLGCVGLNAKEEKLLPYMLLGILCGLHPWET